MSKKKTRSKDPHSWIKDTTKRAAKSKPAGASAADDVTFADQDEAEAEAAPPRFVTFEYDPKDGRILAAHEVPNESGASQTPASLAEGKAAAMIALTGELHEKTLLDLHQNYKVVVSATKPTLVPKG